MAAVPARPPGHGSRLPERPRSFGGLTVRETVMVALEARQRSLLIPSLLALPPSPIVERTQAQAGRRDHLATSGSAATPTTCSASSPPGTRRIVELASLLALDARLILLDEPTAGVAQKETETFGPLIKTIQTRARLVDPHHRARHADGDVDQRPHLLPRGRRGDRRGHARARCATNPKVIASYLGTDERAIQRSGTGRAWRLANRTYRTILRRRPGACADPRHGCVGGHPRDIATRRGPRRPELVEGLGVGVGVTHERAASHGRQRDSPSSTRRT